ncbi:MAG: hypothetical protein RL701_7371 [Pseudomonadota bacterium]
MQDEWDENTFVGTAIAAAPSGARARLIVLAGGNVGEMHEIDQELILGRSSDAHVQLLGDGISRKHARVRILCDESADNQTHQTPGEQRAVFEDLGSTNGSFVNGLRVSEHALVEGDKIQIGAAFVLKFTYQDEVDAGFQRRMLQSAGRDVLTQAYNKRFLLEQLGSEVAFAVRHRTELSLALFEIDGLKHVNEAFGHGMGDLVLCELTRLVLPAIRIEDVFARFGGATFALLSRLGREPALAVAERLRASIAQHNSVHEANILQITVSVGATSMPSPRVTSASSFVESAVRALLAAQAAGRNRVECVVD